jgi:hypothetical protein
MYNCFFTANGSARIIEPFFPTLVIRRPNSSKDGVMSPSFIYLTDYHAQPAEFSGDGTLDDNERTA